MTEYAPINTRLFWANLFERSSKTFVQNLAVAAVGVTLITDVDWAAAFSAAALAAVVSILMALSGTSVPSTGNSLVDTSERAARTFIGSIIASLTVYTGLFEVDWTTALSMALATTVASVATSLGGEVAIGSASLVRK